MPATVRVQIAQATLRAEVNTLTTRYVLRKVKAIRTLAARYTPVDTGNLRASLTWAVYSQGLLVIGTVGTPVEYAYTVHEGHPAMSITVPAHTVKAHTRKGYTVKAVRGRKKASKAGPARKGRGGYTVGAHVVKGHTVRQHWRTIGAQQGRPFLRRALEEVMARPD